MKKKIDFSHFLVCQLVDYHYLIIVAVNYKDVLNLGSVIHSWNFKSFEDAIAFLEKRQNNK